jgi:hypothetical protein
MDMDRELARYARWENVDLAALRASHERPAALRERGAALLATAARLLPPR